MHGAYWGIRSQQSSLSLLRIHWEQSFGIEGDVTLDSHVLQFQSDAPAIKFRGLSDVRVVAIDSDCVEARVAISSFVARTPAASLGFIFCLSNDAYDFVSTSRAIPPARFLVLSPAETWSLTMCDRPQNRLRQLLLAQIPHHRLIPYSISEPTQGSMFVGRRDELEMLMYEDQDFALCGPGGIGKTSLLRQMQWSMRQQRDPRYSRMVEVDLITCPVDLDEAAKRIAKAISPTLRAEAVECKSLEKFLRRTRLGDERFHDGPIDLIIDEADEILSLDRRTAEGDHRFPLMRQLRYARLHGIIRLTISGRKETAMLLNDPENPFAVGREAQGNHNALTRFKLLNLSTFNDADSRELLLGPLKDLGYPINSRLASIEQGLCRCRGIPIDIQALGLDLANNLVRERRRQHV